jgi:hypothetical protein
MSRAFVPIVCFSFCILCASTHADEKPSTQPAAGIVTKLIALKRTSAESEQVASSLKQLMVACLSYSQAHNGQLPHDLGDLLPTLRNEVSKEEKVAIFTDPRNPVQAPDELTADWVNEHAPWKLIAPDVLIAQVPEPAATIVLHTDLEKPFGKKVFAAFADGHAESIDVEKAKEQIEASKKKLGT